MERFMQELMVVTIDTRESQSDNTIALPTVSHCPYRFSIPNTSILYKEEDFHVSFSASRIPARRGRSAKNARRLEKPR